MPTPIPSRRPAPTSSTGDDDRSKPTISSPEWRCTRCEKLLGICREGQMHLRRERGHEYFVGFPVVATCRGCGTLNRITAPATC